MGEVYRARDPRLGRDVALKVLPGSAATADQVMRLEREARATSALNHPNILVVFDVGTEEGRPFIVSELLEGETLRERLGTGPMPVRKALEYAAQVAEGLAAAHDKGVCHRDLKPENIFLTSDGRVKILDFGLAKVISPAAREDGSTSGVSDLSTRPGIVLGTTAYMSPEQVRGQPADHRSDIFAFGALLYEMASGHRAFHGETAIETLNAILHEDPTELPQQSGVSIGLAHLVRRCLEKRPEDRFQSARDLAFQLKELQGVWATTRPTALARLGGRRGWNRVAVAALAIAMLVAGGLTVRRLARGSPTFRQLTFHQGTIFAARFGADGRSVLYSAAWEGRPSELRLGLLEEPESRSLGFPGARLLGVSEREVALLLRLRHAGAERFPGTLARVPLAGGAPREVADGVEDADWGRGGELAVVRSAGVGTLSTLELPLGHVLHKTSASLRHPRVRPQGDLVAFLEDPTGYGFGGEVAVVDRSGSRRALTPRWANARGLAWTADGREVWFTAAEEGEPRALWAVSLSGAQRLVARVPGSLTLHDVSGDRVLATVDAERRGVMATAPGDPTERELSWFDRSGLADISPDGRRLLFGDRLGVYIRETNGSPAVRLGEGFANSLSPDGRWAVATSRTGDRILLLPTGAGQPRELTARGIASYEAAWLLPDGETMLLNGREEGQPMRAYVQRLAGGPAHAVTTPGVWSAGLAADPAWMVALGAGAPLSLSPLAGGAPRPIAGSAPGDRPAGWSADGRSLWVFRRGELPVHVDRLEVATGARSLWRVVQPADPAGVVFVSLVRVTPDGAAYAYSYRRVLSDLFLVDGLR